MITSPHSKWIVALGLPLLVMIICVIIAFSSLFATNVSYLSAAVTLDLTVTAPLLYFLAIHKTSVSKASVIRVFLVGVFVAGLLPSHQNPWLHGIRTWIWPVVEALMIFTVAWKFYQVRRSGTGNDVQHADFLTQSRTVISSVLGNEHIGRIMGSEFAIFYYVFAPIKAYPGNSFSYARSTAAVPVLCVFMISMLAEGLGLHFLVAHWSLKTAWVLSGLSAYAMLQLYAHMRAMKARPIRVVGGKLYLRNGLAADICVRIADIEEASLISRREREEEAVKLALFGALESYTMRLKLCQPATVVRMFGIRQQAQVLYFAVDKPQELLALLSTDIR